MGKEHDEVKEIAHDYDAEKGEKGDSGKQVAEAGHQFRNDAQDEAAKGDSFSKNLTEDWDRDRSKK